MFDTHNTTAIIAMTTILASTGLGVFARVVSRNDGHQHIEVGDFSISLEIIIALIGVLAAQTFEYFKHNDQPNSNEVAVCIVGLMGLMFWLWCISTLIRKIGWKN